MSLNVISEDELTKEFLSLPVSFRADLIKFARDEVALCQSEPSPIDFAQVETEIVAHAKQLGLARIKAYIEQLDDGAKSLERDGHSWYRLAPTTGSLTCLFGKVAYQRPRYRRRGKSKSICPVDEQLGLLPGSMSRPAGKLAMSLVAAMPPRHCHETLQQIGGMTPSVKTLQRILQETHWAWQNVTEEALVDIRSAEDIPAEAKTVAVSLDGAMVQLRPGEYPLGTEVGDTKASGNWREAACGTISLHDKDGNRVWTISSGRMPEKNKITLKQWLSQELEAVLRKRPALTFVTIADGALDNWSYLTNLASDAEILDFYHATTHLAKASEYAQSKTSWYRKWRHTLRHDHDGVGRTIGAIRGLRDRAKSEAARKELSVVLAYFRTHRHRMNYAVLRAKGLPIGSGIVEAANKTHIGERLKKSGMRWSMAGGQAVLSFRSLVKSNRFDQAWSWILKEINNRNPDNDNWKLYYEKKAA